MEGQCCYKRVLLTIMIKYQFQDKEGRIEMVSCIKVEAFKI